MSHWILALSEPARELVKGEIAEHGRLVNYGENANAHSITLFLIEEVVRLRQQVKDLQDAAAHARDR